MLKTILSKWSDDLGSLPKNYLAYDLETTGIDIDEDLIVELGYCLVNDGLATTYHSHVIDWTNVPGIDLDWLKYKLQACDEHMAKSGRSSHMTLHRMKSKGSPPETVFQEYIALFNDAAKNKLLVVGHNAVQFDNPFVEAAFKEWLDVDWTFPDFVFDTAAVVKASLCQMPPWPEETLQQYFFRVLDRPAPGVKYNLDTFCVQKFQLLEKYPGLDLADAHTAGFDAMLTHLLLEEFRIMANSSTWSLD